MNLLVMSDVEKQHVLKGFPSSDQMQEVISMLHGCTTTRFLYSFLIRTHTPVQQHPHKGKHLQRESRKTNEMNRRFKREADRVYTPLFRFEIIPLLHLCPH